MLLLEAPKKNSLILGVKSPNQGINTFIEARKGLVRVVKGLGIGFMIMMMVMVLVMISIAGCVRMMLRIIAGWGVVPRMVPPRSQGIQRERWRKKRQKRKAENHRRKHKRSPKP